MLRRGVLFLIAVTAPFCCAQVSGADVDQIPNWPAPLYWQRLAKAVPAHKGGMREEAIVREAAASSTLGVPAVFVAMTPCRVVDTRNANGPFGGPAFAASEIRTIPMPTSACTIPATAVAYSLNIAVVPVGTTMRWLTAWDTGDPQPNASTLNDKAGLITSNSAVVPAGTGGSINVFVTDATNVIVDINGYYAMPSSLPLTGTAAAPALTFADTTTGLYSDTARTVSIATGGTSRLTVRSDGDLELPGSIRKHGTLFLHNIGINSVAVGLNALSNGSGVENTAAGVAALFSNTTGCCNTAAGSNSLGSNTSGAFNTAVGVGALLANTSGGSNTAMGVAAFHGLTTGSNNTAVGQFAGNNATTGSYNVYIANQGAVADTNIIRIGDSNQTQTFIAGIRGVTTGNADAIPVVIDSNGQLGTASSSRRVKRDIHDMRDTTGTIMGLHPVEFRYTAHGPDAPIQFGLIAEEVAETAPDLVAHNAKGEIETVYYDKVNAMLLNQVQTQQRLIERLESRIVELENRAK
jgi:hypothetical protein